MSANRYRSPTGLRARATLGDFRLQTPWVIAPPQMKIPDKARTAKAKDTAVKAKAN